MNSLPEKILLATDGSDDAALAARAAVDLSERFGSPLHVVHAWHSLPSAHFESMIRAYYKDMAKELLAKGVARIKDAGGAVAEAHLQEGRAADAILGLAEKIEADLVVLGSRGHGPVERIVIGSVSEGVVRGAACPVLVVRDGPDAWPPERVVLGDDGSEEARAAVEMGAKVGGVYGARGLLVQTYPSLMEVDVEGDTVTARMLDDEGWFKTGERNLGEKIEEIEGALGSRPKLRVASGDPTVCLLSAAEEGDAPERSLIAVGRRGLGAVRRATLGSVATKVLHVARGPILVCPARDG
ncbi:universal stress protein [Rubrobacter marinus]|uniref:universal stress protein n=1 Tax=Rubrobacter marinus TaxID=2653852 RepID=UPI00140B39EF|nr:universal stress protein [Rubrobacter marinus]